MKKLLILTGISGAVAVILGAFGAHALSEHLSDSQLNTYDIASKYHFYHTLALLGVALLYRNTNKRYIKWAGYAFGIGIILFSGSLYLLACKDMLQLGSWTKIIGPVTPIGGLFFIIGWLLLVLSQMRNT